MLLPKPERLALLTPEQRAVYDNWLKEANQFDALLQRLTEVMEQPTNDLGQQHALVKQITDEMDRVAPEVCEHERSVFSSCAACNEIEMILYPELLDENGDWLVDDLGEIDELN